MKKWLYFALPLGGAVVGGAIVVLWGATLHQQDKFSVFVALLTILLAALGVGGYEAYRSASRSLERSMDEKISKFEKGIKEEERKIRTRVEEGEELFMAKLHYSIGYMFWQQFRLEQQREKKRADSSEAMLKDLLEMAIDRARISLDHANKLPESECEREICGCKNNLAYFLAEAVGVKNLELTKRDKQQGLELAEYILEKASKERHPGAYYEWKETSAFVLLRLTEPNDVVSKQRAHHLFNELQDDTNIPFAWREEVKRKWTGLLG